jgi:ParB/RepB/Spo0J family partition protein
MADPNVYSVVLAIPLDKLHDHPLNPRHEIPEDDALREMAASMQAHGVLEPLLVIPDGPRGGDWLLVAGHRRRAAAKLAGLTEVPGIPRPDLADNIDVLVTMLSENGHRKDLSAMEEADGFKQLELLGLDAGQISDRVGTGAATVKRRLKLTGLPEQVRERVHAGQVTLSDAEALTEFNGDEKAVEDVLKAWETYHNMSWAIESVKGKRETAAKSKEAKAALKAEGTTIIPEPRQFGWGSVAKSLVQIPNPDSAGGHYTPETHKDCPFHAAFIGPAGGAIYVCTNPEEAGHKVDRSQQPHGGMSEEQLAKREEEHEALMAALEPAHKVRRKFLSEFMSSRDKETTARLLRNSIPAVASTYFRADDADDIRLFCDLAGLDLPDLSKLEQAGQGDSWVQARNAMHEVWTKVGQIEDQAKLARVLMAVFCFRLERGAGDYWGWQRGEQVKWIESLRDKWGYEITPEEQGLIDEFHGRAERCEVCGEEYGEDGECDCDDGPEVGEELASAEGEALDEDGGPGSDDGEGDGLEEELMAAAAAAGGLG